MKLLWFTEYILEKSRDITQAEFLPILDRVIEDDK